MNNLKNVLCGLWVRMKVYIGQAAGFVFNHSEALSNMASRSKASECLKRTRNAYLALTGYNIKDQITPHALDNIIRGVRSYGELCALIENAGACKDRTYAYLLLIAIAEVYKSSDPPVLGPGFFPNLLK